MLCVRAPAWEVSVPGHTWPHTMLSRPLGTAPAFPHPAVLPCNSQCSHVRTGVGCSKLTGDSNDKVTKSPTGLLSATKAQVVCFGVFPSSSVLRLSPGTAVMAVTKSHCGGYRAVFPRSPLPGEDSRVHRRFIGPIKSQVHKFKIPLGFVSFPQRPGALLLCRKGWVKDGLSSPCVPSQEGACHVRASYALRMHLATVFCWVLAS